MKLSSYQEQGVALVVVLLLTVVVLMVILSTTASVTLGTRRGGGNERLAYQALLIAESGVGTFGARFQQAAAAAPAPLLTATDSAATWKTKLNDWLTQSNVALNRWSISGGTLQLSVVAADPITRLVSVEAVGTMSGDAAQKRVVQDFEYGLSASLSGVRPNAALISKDAVRINGSLSIDGQANVPEATRVASTATYASTASEVPLKVTDATYLQKDDYLRIDQYVYKVLTKVGNDLTVKPVNTVLTSGSITLSAQTPVRVVMNAVNQPYPLVLNPDNLAVNGAKDFIKNEKITLNGVTGTVIGVNDPVGTIRVQWQSATPGLVNEGTPVIRDVVAVRSGGLITPKTNKLDDMGIDKSADGYTKEDWDCTASGKGNNATTTCKGNRDPLLQSAYLAQSGQSLEEQLLGMTDAQINQKIPLEALGSMPQSGIHRVSAATFNTISNTSGGGVLIVDGDVDANWNGNVTFGGFIYFRNSFGGKLNGNLTINGAVAVRGQPIDGLSQELTANGNARIHYDPLVLRAAFASIQWPGSMSAKVSTWRQR